MPDGSCSQSIPKCQPVLSLRGKRGVSARWVSAVALGALFFLVPSPQGQKFISPGDISSKHGSLALSCGNCHSVFQEGPTGWFRAAFDPPPKKDDSARCVSCHDLGKNSGRPHSIEPQRISLIQERAGKRKALIGEAKLDARTASAHSLPCSACHSEHRGGHFDLRSMDDRRCQSCHMASFAGFGRDHPDFSTFPYVRRTPLIFDHVSHLGKHFQEGEFKSRAPSECKDCHLPDPSGSYMLSRNFSRTCAACHLGQILGEGRAGAKGIAVFSVPGLDAEALRKEGFDPGRWPRDAEEELTPFVRFLLSGNPAFRRAEETLKDVDLLDLAKATPEERKAAEELAWSVKEILFDFLGKGHPAMKARMEAALGRRMSDAEAAALSGQMPLGVLRAAQEAWFPRLAAEMARRHAASAGEDGRKAAQKEEEETSRGPSADEAMSAFGGWYLQDFAVYYRPGGHTDTFLRAWLDLSAGAGAQGILDRVLAVLAGPKAPGYCAKCHSIDAADGVSRVNWTGKQPEVNLHDFNRYKHAPHFSLLDERGCVTCHRLNRRAEYLEAFKGRDPARFVSNFLPMGKKDCASCHATGKARDNCLTCHNYHVGKVAPALVSAPMKMPDSKSNAGP